MNKPTLTMTLLENVTYEQFKEFLDSLDEERKTWSLDLQSYKNSKEFYENQKQFSLICIVEKHLNIDVDKEKVIALCNCYMDCSNSQLIEVSFVVKKDYQGMGIGTELLKKTEWLASHHKKHRYISAKHYKDNIASHKAFLKAGYKEWTIDEKIFDDDGNIYFRKKEGDAAFNWKIKEIG